MKFLIKKIIRNVYSMTELELGVVRLKIMKYKYSSDYLNMSAVSVFVLQRGIIPLCTYQNAYPIWFLK